MLRILIRTAYDEISPTFGCGTVTLLCPRINSGNLPESLKRGHNMQMRRMGLSEGGRPHLLRKKVPETTWPLGGGRGRLSIAQATWRWGHKEGRGASIVQGPQDPATDSLLRCLSLCLSFTGHAWDLMYRIYSSHHLWSWSWKIEK